MITVEGQQVYDTRIKDRVTVLYMDSTHRLLDMDKTVRIELGKIEALCFANDKLSLKDSMINTRLQRLINDVLHVTADTVNQVGGYIKVPTHNSDSILVSVFPCRAIQEALSSCYLGWAEIRITHPRPTNLDVFSRAMRDIYELSASESKVVSLLVQGRNTKEIASSLHVADSTLRTHLKRIFSKTETRNQAELVSKILLRDTYAIPNLFA